MAVATFKLEQGELTALAQATGRSSPHVLFVLRGERVPSVELAEKLRAYLGDRTPASVLQVLMRPTVTGPDDDGEVGL